MLKLYTTKTCPNCEIVKEHFNKNNIEYELVDAELKENRLFLIKNKIMSVPCVVTEDNNFIVGNSILDKF